MASGSVVGADSKSRGPLAPGRILSLWEIMLDFCMSGFCISLTDFARAVTALHFNKEINEIRIVLKKSINLLVMHLAAIEASELVIKEAQRLEKLIDGSDVDFIVAQCISFYHNLTTELEMHLFVKIDCNEKYVFSDNFNPCGDNVNDKFPELIEDMRAAARCMAFQESNACVFHCMRALERGIIYLAKKIGIEGIEFENWKNIIDQIEKKISEIEKTPKSKLKSDKLKYYSSAAIQFRYFKEAWRNHCMHARVWYDIHTALSIMMRRP
jgi:hypothetical protein